MQLNPRTRFCGLLASAITIVALLGCNGSTGPAGASTSTAGVTNGSTLSAAQWVALNPVGTVTSVNVSATSGRPVVNFTLTDSTGKGVVGLGGYTKFNTTTDLIPSYPNLTFTIAKLIPAGGLPSAPTPNAQAKWVNYMVMSTPNVATPTAVPQGPGTESCLDTSAKAAYGLVDHGDGTYTYTFYTDITKVASAVSAYGTANSVDVSALDPTNLVFDANAPTRVVIEFFGNARGAGTGQHANTPDGSNGTATAEIQHPLNIVYDFTPATGKPVAPSATSREIVALATCNTCHTRLAYHGGHRVDPRNCTVCHTDQRRFGFTEAPRSADATTFTGGVTEQVNNTAEFDFDQLIHQVHMGSNLHMKGHDIDPDTASTYTLHSKTTTIAGEYAINFPTNTENCTICHASVTAADGVTVLNPQAGNWATAPSRAACGGCHDDINFISVNSNHTGGQQLTEAQCAGCHNASDITIYHTGLMSPVENGTNVSQRSSQITNNWQATNPANMPLDPLNPAAGNNAATISYNIVSATVNAAGNPVVQFQILANPNTTGSTATALVLNNYAGVATAEALPAPYAAGPSIALSMGIPEDGITPTDFNYGHNDSSSWPLRQIWNKTATKKAGGLVSSTGVTLVAGTTTTYQVVMDGYVVPSGTQLVGIGIGFTGVVQTNLTSNPILNNRPGGAPNFSTWAAAPSASTQGTGGVLIPATTIWTSATGTVPGATPTTLIARREIIKPGACQSCHGNLGAFTTNGAPFSSATTPYTSYTVTGAQSATPVAIINSFHANQFNDGAVCVFCHTTIGSTGGWSYNAKTWVHALHASGMRNNQYTAQGNFPGIIYPGLLQDCTSCHVAGSYDFSNSKNAGQISGMLWDTVATGTGAASGWSPWTTPGTNYGVTAGYTAPVSAATAWTVSQPANYQLSAVVSPITAACGACHDSKTAVAHFVANGGQWYAQRVNVPLIGNSGTPNTTAQTVGSIVLKSNEQCLVCHGPGQVEDIAVVHANF